MRKLAIEKLAVRIVLLGGFLLGMILHGAAQQFGLTTQSAVTFLPSIINTVAGTGVTGHTGDGGLATSATMSTGIRGIAADAAGDIYFVDTTYYAVRVIYEGGTSAAALITATNSTVTTPIVGYIYTVAGVEGTAGTPVTGGLATSSASGKLTPGAGLTIDAAGDIFFSAYTNELWVVYAGGSVAKNLINLEDSVSAPVEGYIYHLAGTGTAGTGGNGALAISGTLFSVNGLWVDDSGNVFTVDQGSSATCGTSSTVCGNTVREISASTGYISIVAGANTNVTTTCASNASATVCDLNQPYGVVVDTAGDIYIDDKGAQLLRMVYEGGTQAKSLLAILYPSVTPTVGYIYTVAGGTAGTGTGTYAPTIASPVLAYGSGSSAYLKLGNGVTGIAMDAVGNIYLVDNQSGYTNVVEVNVTTGMAAVVAGTGTADSTPTGTNGDGGVATSATFDVPRAIAVDAAGRIYVTDASNMRVRQIGPQGMIAFSATGTVGVTSADSSALILANMGNSAATLSYEFAGTDSADFSVDTTTTTCSTTLAANATCDLYLTFTPTAAGSRTATLTYTTTDGALTSHVINVSGTALPATTSALVSSLSTVEKGNTVTLTDTVTGTATAAPTGTVTFYNGTTSLGTATLAATTGSTTISTASLTYTTITAGSMSVTASYPGDTLNGISTSAAVTVYVTGSATSTSSVAANSMSPAYGQNDTLTATVTGTTTVGDTPSGSVIFYDGATALGTGTLPASTTGTAAAATFVSSALTTGAHSITVAYSGDTNYQASTSSAITVNVVQATPTISWATPSVITYGTALSAAQLSPTGSVKGSFTYTATLSSSSTAVAVSIGTVLDAGTYTLTATFTPSDTTNYTTTTASVQLVINQATPVITWATPDSIIYGAALTATQLDAIASTTGTFVYSPALGTVEYPGSQILSVTFTPSNTTDYTTTTADVTLLVTVPGKTTPTITWSAPADITYGTELSAIQLNATASVSSTTIQGTYAYTPALGSVLTAGTHNIQVVFTPNDTTDYTVASAVVSITVDKATPTIAWATPADIYYGTALSSTQLDATTSASGTFAYSQAVGTILTAGTQKISVTFTPSDTVDYNTATAYIDLTVDKAIATITWATPAAITYGTALSSIQLDASSNDAGTISYSPVAGTVLSAGSQSLTATFLPTDTSNYATVKSSVTLTVNKATPIITWATPSSITYGTALSSTQLNATANVAGSFSYSPALGTILAAGSQTLWATFTPTETADTSDYNTATDSVALTVGVQTPTITLATSVTPAVAGNNITFTATVASKTSTPAGSVNFLSGTTVLGTGTLTGGVATFTTSSLAAGTYTISAVYDGDSNFAAITSSTLSQSVVDLTFATATSGITTGAAQTVVSGGTATYELAITPTTGTSLPLALTFTISGLPTGATAILNPAAWVQSDSTTWTLPAGTSVSSNMQLNIVLPQSTTASIPTHGVGKRQGRARVPLALVMLLLPFAGRLRQVGKRMGRMFIMLLVLAAGTVLLTGLTGCGTANGFLNQGQEVYSVTATVSAGTLSHSTTLSLTVE